MCAVSAITVAQDAAGQYKLTGVNVLYTYVARGDFTLTVTDAYGLGLPRPFHKYQVVYQLVVNPCS